MKINSNIIIFTIFCIILSLYYLLYILNDETPNHIWLYWENVPGKTKSNLIDLCHDTIYRHCKNSFHIHLLDENTVYDYLPKLRRDLNEILSIPHKSDYIRYCLLYKYGGIWLDSDTIILKDLKPLLNKIISYGFIASGPNYISTDNPMQYGLLMNETINNRPNIGTIGCIKNHPLLKILIDNCDKMFENHSKLNYLDISYYNLWDALDYLSLNGLSYYHIPSECNYHNNDNKYYTNNMLYSTQDLDLFCMKKAYFIMFYNTSSSKKNVFRIPENFKNKPKNEILKSPYLISKILKYSLTN